MSEEWLFLCSTGGSSNKSLRAAAISQRVILQPQEVSAVTLFRMSILSLGKEGSNSFIESFHECGT